MLKHTFEEVPWTTRQTLNGLFLTLLPWLAFAFVLSLSNTKTGTQTSTPLPFQTDLLNALITFLFSSLVEGAFLIAPFYFARRALHTPAGEQRSIKSILGFERFSLLKAVPLIFLFIIAIFLVNGAYAYFITALHLNIQVNDQVVLNEGKVAPITTYATLLAAVFIAPFCEEIFFRSFVFMGLLRDLPLGWAIVFSALIFGVAHGDPSSFPVLFAIGLPLAYLRWSTRSIWPGMLLHMLNNGLSALFIIQALHQ